MRPDESQMQASSLRAPLASHQSAPVRLAVREWKLAAPLGQGGRGDADDKKQHDQWVEEPVGLSSHICSTSLCSCCPVSFCHCLRIAFKPMKDHPIWRPIFGPKKSLYPSRLLVSNQSLGF
jgi:hypothetical protein